MCKLGIGPYANALAICKTKEARLPEVHTVQDKRELEDIMKQHIVTQVRAGLHYDRISNQYQNSSDNSNILMS